MRPIIVLRPEPGASETVRRARELGLDARPVPMFAVTPIAWEAPDPARFDALLLTSANALRHGGEGLHALRGLPVHAVGAATAAAARDAGFDVASTGDCGVDRLLGSIAPDLRLLHPCGADRHEPGDVRQQVAHVPVYRAEPIDAPPLDGAAGSVALVHSRRAAARFAELIDRAGIDRATIAIAAISAGAGKAAGSGWRAVDHAARPDDAALLALAARLCQRSAGE